MASYMDDLDSAYIDSLDYDDLVTKIKNLDDVSFDLTSKVLASRKLRYAEVDVELERNAGKLAPDELYIPLHVIDTNIRREQSSYIQFLASSPRAVICKDKDDPAFDLQELEVDLTEKLHYEGWQLEAFANVDGFQANGYGIVETVRDTEKPGEIGREYCQFGDFSFIADTRDLQKVEMVGRAYYFTKTKLLNLVKKSKELEDDDVEKWNETQVKKLTDAQPNDEQSNIYSGTATINRSLYKVMKVMFKYKGTVMVGWTAPKQCSDWLRKPRKLFLGRRKINDSANKLSPYVQQINQMPINKIKAFDNLKKLNSDLTDEHIKQMSAGLPASDPQYETVFPYWLYQYLISENNTIACLKGRIFLDQDTQNGASSLLSSLLTKARRSGGLYFSKDTTDPNDDFLLQKNIQFKQGALINGKVKEFTLQGPDAQLFTALQTLISANQQETSQVNFAETNRQADSRKTATAIKASQQQQQLLSSVQVALFSVALNAEYSFEVAIIKSRVLAGLIDVSPSIKPLYARKFKIKPSGDTDVIERKQLLQDMESAWPVVENTGCADLFMADYLQKKFPDSAAKYIKAIQNANQQKQTQQAQQQQNLLNIGKQTADGVIHLSQHPEYFNETGRTHAFPIIETAAEKFKEMMQSQKR
jgi:hypothetical protein